MYETDLVNEYPDLSALCMYILSRMHSDTAKELAAHDKAESSGMEPPHSLSIRDIPKKTMTRIPYARLYVTPQFKCHERVIHNSQLIPLKCGALILSPVCIFLDNPQNII